MDVRSILPGIILRTRHLLDKAPSGVESLQIIQGRTLRHEYLDRLATKQAWPILALIKGQGPEAAHFTKRHYGDVSRILNLAALVGRELAEGSDRVVYVDFRVARDEVRWRAKSVGLPGLELVAHSPSEISLLVNQMVGDRV